MWPHFLRLLPLPERVFVVAALLCALVPPCLVAYRTVGDPTGLTLASQLGAFPGALAAAAVGLIVMALLLLERPTSISPRLYAQQLVRRWTVVQSHFADKRRLEEVAANECRPPPP